jgi:nucleotide-binding universal stress UspA family protein
MYRNILVPLDGSFTSERILPWAGDLAVRTGARVKLVRVLPKGQDASNGHSILRQRRDAFAYLRQVESRMREAGVPTQALLRAGPPAATIAKTAILERADVIALSARGAGRATRILLGGTAERLLRLSSKPLYIAHSGLKPAGPPPLRLQKILVPVDGSALSESALPFAADLAGWYQGGIILVHVRSTRTPAGDPDRLEELAELLRVRGIPATVRIMTGDAVEQILTAAKRHNADLIAMNSHGRGGFAKLFLGSVAEEIIHAGRAPVFVTKNRRPVPLARAAREAVGAGAQE